MGFADETELAQSKHDPPTEPIIADPVHSLPKKAWGKTRQTAKTKAVLRPLPRVSHSLAALIIIWLRGAWYLWRGKATYGQAVSSTKYTWSDNEVRELIAVKVLHTSLLNTTVVAFKVLPLGSYAPMPAPSPPFKTLLEMVLWNGLQSCRCITPDVINVIKMPSFQYFLYLREQKKVTGG